MILEDKILYIKFIYNKMDFKLYTLTKSSIKEVNVTIVDYPLGDRNLSDIIDNISEFNNQSNALINAVKDGSYKAIESFLDNDPIRWIKFSRILTRFIKEIIPNPVDKVEELPLVLQQILDNPLFKVTAMAKENILYKILVSYLDYRFMTVYDYYYMLSRGYQALTSQLMDMLHDYFPNKTYKMKSTPRKFIDYILRGTKYTFRDIPYIIYTLTANSSVEYNTLKEYLNSNNEMTERLPTVKINPRKYYDIEDYKIYDDSIDFNIYVYKNNKIDMLSVTFKLGSYITKQITSTNDFFTILYSINNYELNHVLARAMVKNDINPDKVANFLGESRERWDVFASNIVNGKKNKYLNSLVDNEMFKVSRDLFTRKFKNVPDEVKLKSDRDVVPYYLDRKININVLGFLLYDLLSDIFRENVNYMNELQYYSGKLDDNVEEAEVQRKFIKKLLKKEGIKYDNSIDLFNVLSVLCVQYYNLDDNVSQYNNLGEYWNSVIDKVKKYPKKMFHSDILTVAIRNMN